jgi:hypothetical protein
MGMAERAVFICNTKLTSQALMFRRGYPNMPRFGLPWAISQGDLK